MVSKVTGFILALISFSLFSQTVPRSDFRDLMGTSAQINLIQNPRCYRSVQGVTATGGTTLASNNTSPITQDFDCEISMTGSDQAVGFNSLPMATIASSLFGQVCEYSFDIKAGLSDTVVEIVNNEGVQAVVALVTDSGTRTYRGLVSCGTANVSQPIVVKSSDSPGTFNMANVYFGAPRIGSDFGEISQSFLFGTFTQAPQANCEWSNTDTSGTPAAFGADSDCTSRSVTGLLQLPSTLIPAFVIPANSPSGRYEIKAIGDFRAQRAGLAASAVFSFFNGSLFSRQVIVWNGSGSGTSDLIANSTSLLGSFQYTSQPTDMTVEVRATSTLGTNSPAQRVRAIDSGLQFVVTYIPNSTQVVYNPLRDDMSGFAKHAATANCLWTTTSASMASFGVDADCPTPTVSGNAAAPATKIPAFVVPKLLPGRYEITAASRFIATNSSSGAPACFFEIYDGTNSGGIQGLSGSASEGTISTLTMSGVFEYTSIQTNVQFQIRGWRGFGNGSCDVSGTTNDLVFTLKPLSQGLQQPFIPGSVFVDSTPKYDPSGITTIATGTYTPTLTNTTNITSSTVNRATWTRIGNSVTVNLAIQINPTSASGAATTLRISVPIARTTNFSSADNGSGVGATGFVDTRTHNQSGRILSVSGAQLMEYRFNAQDSSAATHSMTFEYRLD
jgi:hypothetical protein